VWSGSERVAGGNGADSSMLLFRLERGGDKMKRR
jgi:hypothetical protein